VAAVPVVSSALSARTDSSRVPATASGLQRVARLCEQLSGDVLGDVGLPIADRSRPGFVTLALDSPADALRVARLLRDNSEAALAIAVHTEVGDGVHRIPGSLVARRAAQLAAAADPGQLLMSDTTVALSAAVVASPAQIVGLGAHRVYALERTDPISQLVEPGRPDDHAPIVSLIGRTGNVPMPPGPLVGRLEDLERVVSELTGARCVTLVGVGGVGKTRLAMRVAGELLAFHDDGVWVVDLSPIADPALVAATIARVVGARVDRVDDAANALAAHLSTRCALLVVDNCEGVAAEVGAILAMILARCPEVSVLATSREPLPLRGGRSVVLGPLSTQAPPGMQPEAVSLFMDRAPVTAHWSPDRTELAAIAAICEQLDGLPLAVELVAAATLSATPTHLAQQLLARTLDLGGPMAGHNRHRTLRDALDWSHDLLDADEALALRRLSVCHGFDADLARAVVGVDDLATSSTGLVDRLVQQSLVVPAISAPPAGRYRMLHVVREHALERLDASGEAEAVRDAHSRFVVERATALHDSVRRDGSTAALDRLEADLANIRAALEHLYERGRFTDALEVLLGTQLFWNSRHPTEALIWYRRLLDHADGLEEVRAATLLAEAGRIALHAGEVELAETLCWRSHGWARRAGRCPPGAAYSALTQLLLYDNDAGAALSLCEEAMAELSAAGDHIGLLSVRGALSGAAHALGHSQRAIDVAAENRAVAERSGNRTLEAGAMLTYATAHRKVDRANARRLLDDALSLARDAGPTVTKWALIECAQVDLDLGLVDMAHAEFREAVALADDAGDPTALAAGLEGCAAVAVQRGELLAALRLVDASTQIRTRPRRAGRPDDVALRQRVLATLARATDDSRARGRSEAAVDPAALAEAVAFCKAWVPGREPPVADIQPADPTPAVSGSLAGDTEEGASFGDLVERHLSSREVIRRRYAPGAAIFRVRDPARLCYLVVSGAAKLSLTSAEGREVVWSIATAGDLLGDVAPLVQTARWCDATAINEVVVAEIPAVTLGDAARRRPDLARAWLVTLAARLKEAAERQVQFGALDARARVCVCLLGLAERFGAATIPNDIPASDGKLAFVLPFPQHDLASWAGISREALVRALRSLRATGALATNGREFVIDVDRLRAQANLQRPPS
jgi:predicted ATPase/CRP-like cAMP-binding protein